MGFPKGFNPLGGGFGRQSLPKKQKSKKKKEIGGRASQKKYQELRAVRYALIASVR